MPNDAVTLVTKDATLDDLSIADYRDMVQELRGSLSLDKLIIELGSQYSKPLWAKVEKGEATPNRNQRNELRRYYKLPPLPPTVTDAVTAVTSPDAAVWRIGATPAEHVIMVTTTEPLTLHVNGSVTVATNDAECHRSDVVTGVTATKRQRTYFHRPTATEAQNRRRMAVGATWQEVINAGLSHFENEKDGAL